MAGKQRAKWDAYGVKALRRHLGLTQGQMAEELGTRQQTISEWETGLYQPRGVSERFLSVIAERAGFEYGAANRRPPSTLRCRDTGDAGEKLDDGGLRRPARLTTVVVCRQLEGSRDLAAS